MTNRIIDEVINNIELKLKFTSADVNTNDTARACKDYSEALLNLVKAKAIANGTIKTVG